MDIIDKPEVTKLRANAIGYTTLSFSESKIPYSLMPISSNTSIASLRTGPRHTIRHLIPVNQTNESTQKKIREIYLFTCYIKHYSNSLAHHSLEMAYNDSLNNLTYFLKLFYLFPGSQHLKQNQVKVLLWIH